MYTYAAEVIHVVDGDTVDVTIDLGFFVTTTQRVRLAGINTPEIRGGTKTAGLVSKSYTETWVKTHGPKVQLESQKPYADDKYGRFLATLRSTDGKSCLNAELLAGGLAVPLTY